MTKKQLETKLETMAKENVELKKANIHLNNRIARAVTLFKRIRNAHHSLTSLTG